MAPPQVKKKSQGRRKIEMKLIADENARTVTFSKGAIQESHGAFCPMWDSDRSHNFFSWWSFGHPDVESIIGRFFNRSPVPTPSESVHGTMLKGSWIRRAQNWRTRRKEKKKSKWPWKALYIESQSRG